MVTHVRAGYFDEPDHWAGIAHVLEHMFFKGTGRRGPGQIARETQLLGGYLNASTTYDKTVYFTVLPAAPEALARALDIQADALTDCALDPAELAREIEVIVQEARRKLDNPRAMTTETLYQLLFRVHRMRRWRIGSQVALRALTPDDVRAYYESRYRPDRTILGVAGRIDPEAALHLIEQRYGRWRRISTPIDAGPREPAARAASLSVLSGDVTRPFASIGWRTVDPLHPDAPALDVLAVILGSGRGSRLWREVRGPGLASAVHASHYTPTEVGVFEITLECDPSRVREAIARALDTATRAEEQPPGASEMERARALLAAHRARQIESMDGRAALLCEFEALGDYRLADDMLERRLRVSAEDMARVASDHLPRAASCCVAYVAQPREAGLGDDDWPLPPAERPAAAVDDQRSPLGERRATLPSTRRQKRRRWGDVACVQGDGADFLVCARPGAGLVSLSLWALGLRDHETEETAGLTAWLMRAALRGAGGMSAERLAVAAETLGGAVSASIGTEAAGFSLTVPSAATASAARLLVTIAREPHLSEPDLVVERELLAGDAARARDDMFGHPLQAALRQAFEGHQYGLPALGDPEGVRRLRVDVLAEHARRLREARAVFVACGDLPEQELLSALERAWPGSAGRSATGRKTETPGWRAAQGQEERDKAQTALAMAFPAPPFGAPQRLAIEVLCAHLAGLAGRLFRVLRDQRSLAYTVAALPWLRRRAGAVLTYIATSPEREAEARAGMLEELGRAGEEHLSALELARARNYAAGLVQIRRQHAAAWAAEIVEAHVHGAAEDLGAVPDRLRSVDATEVTGAARAIFRVDQAAEYVVRGVETSR